MPAFIKDGYTVDSFISEDVGIHEAVTFTFRPATAREYRKWLTDRIKEVKDSEASPDAVFLKSHMVSWDLKDGNSLVDITAENCDQIHPNVSSGMINQIAGDSKPGIKIESAKGN